jgi:hypothetical protein
MKATKLITIGKQFIGPFICVYFAWQIVRWTRVNVEAVETWPWLDCSTGVCDPLPEQTYVVTPLLALISLAVYALLGSFLYSGWGWFREGRKPH